MHGPQFRGGGIPGLFDEEGAMNGARTVAGTMAYGMAEEEPGEYAEADTADVFGEIGRSGEGSGLSRGWRGGRAGGGEHQWTEPLALPAVLGQLISDGETPNLALLRFRVKPGKHTHAGKMVAVDARDASGRRVLILARVNNVREQNPHENAQSSTVREVLPFQSEYAPEGVSTVIWRIAEIEPMEEAVLDDQEEVVEVKSVETLPRAGSVVLEAGSGLTIQALGLQTDPEEGMEIGQIYGDAATPVILDRRTIQRHVLIVGGIGSGKSYTRGVLAEELRCLGVPQVNVDVNGEMVKAAEELGGINLQPGKGFSLPLSALSSQDVLEAVPSINPGTNMETLLRYAHEMLQKRLLSGRNPRGYFTVDDLLAAIDPAAEALGLQKSRAQTVEPTKLRTETLKRHGYLGAPYNWRRALTPGAFINIDCTGLLISDLRLIVASIARDLQNLARARQIPFVAFSIDEFHLVAPANEPMVTTQVLRELARIGRHYRLGLILTTQSPQDVDRSILKRLLTRFLHAIEPDQLDALRGVFSDASPELVRQLPKLPQGVCVLTGARETVRHAAVIRIRPRRTTHGGDTPDIFGDLRDRGWPGKERLPEREEPVA